MKNRGECRSCLATIFFAKAIPTDKNPNPKPNPIDEMPDREKGNLLVSIDRLNYKVITGVDLLEMRARGADLFLSHFVTCPAAQAMRMKKAA